MKVEVWGQVIGKTTLLLEHLNDQIDLLHSLVLKHIFNYLPRLEVIRLQFLCNTCTRGGLEGAKASGGH